MYVKELTGYTKPVGWGNNWPIDSRVPNVGGVVVFKYAHVGYITAIDPIAQTFTLTEANYHKNKISTRTLEYNNLTIKGFDAP